MAGKAASTAGRTRSAEPNASHTWAPAEAGAFLFEATLRVPRPEVEVRR
jgi:hypothetical protein